MSKADDTHLWNDTVAHILQEQGFEINEDPRSIYDPEQLWEALDRYAPEFDTFVDKKDPHYINGLNMAYKIYAKPENRSFIKPLQTAEQLLEATKGEKFAGLPSMKKKRDDFIYALDREQQVLKGIKVPAPCLAGKRTQRNNKTRLVWMYPFEMTLMEARFARPLIDTFLDRRTTMAFGMKKFTVGAIVDSISHHQPGKTPVAIDYSKYDSSVPSFLIRQAFRILKTWFSEEDRNKFGWDIVERYFINTPIVMIDGKLYTGKKHGIPSGSYLTQIIGSIINTILMGAMSSALKLGIQWKRFLVLGDDVIVAIENPNLEEMATYLKTFGITLNVQKTKFEAHFLGATWIYGKPTRALPELLAMAVQPESFKYMGNTESEMRLSAYTLLTNYACTYINASRFLDKRFRSPRHMDYYEYDFKRTDLMSGSDRFILEYGRKMEVKHVSRATMLMRTLS